MSWYVISCGEGREEEFLRSLKSRLSGEALEQAFRFRIERLWRGRGGVWSPVVRDMFPGYIFLESRRPELLSEELRQYRGIARVMEEPGFLIPVRREEQAFLTRLCGGSHLMGLSYGYREKGVDWIERGPLKGLESWIVKADWHKRFAKIAVPMAGRRYIVWAGLGLKREWEEMERKEQREIEGQEIGQRKMGQPETAWEVSESSRRPGPDKTAADGRVPEPEAAASEQAALEATLEATYEPCVCCGKPTGVKRSQDISSRRYYIEGAGQLCRDCHWELYGKKGLR